MSPIYLPASDVGAAVVLAPASSSRNTVQPTGNMQALILKGSVGQTGSLFMLQDSAGVTYLRLSPVGKIGWNIFPTSPVHVIAGTTQQTDAILVGHDEGTFPIASATWEWNNPVRVDAYTKEGVFTYTGKLADDADAAVFQAKDMAPIGANHQVLLGPNSIPLIAGRSADGTTIIKGVEISADDRVSLLADTLVNGQLEVQGDLLLTGGALVGVATGGGGGALPWIVSNLSVDRALDANNTTLNEVADGVGTVILDLIQKGVIAGNAGTFTAGNWSFTNTTTRRTLDADNTTLDELVDALGTAVADLINLGTMSGTASVVAGGSWNITNLRVARTLDANATTINEVADVLGTLIVDLTTGGVLPGVGKILRPGTSSFAPTNYTEDYAYNAGTVAVGELANYVATLSVYLKRVGVIP